MAIDAEMLRLISEPLMGLGADNPLLEIVSSHCLPRLGRQWQAA
jgi:hypothetical protein